MVVMGKPTVHSLIKNEAKPRDREAPVLPGLPGF